MRLKSNHIGNILAGILILIIGLQCTACAETYWSIKQVAESTPERWTESYDTPWRTISIDVEIEVPTVEKIPIVRVHRMPAVQDEKLSDYAGTVRNVEGSLRADKKRDDFVSGDSRPQNTYSYTKGQTPDRKPENVEMTYAEALKLGYKEMEKIWGLKEDNLRITKVNIQDCFYYYSGKNESMVWGKRETDQGRYIMVFAQNMCGIDVEAATECYDILGLDSEKNFYSPYCYISLSDIQNIKIRASLYQEKNVVHEDVPILSFESAKKAFEAEIYAGHLRSVDVVKLCYIPYLDKKDKSILWLLPAWYVKGLYTRDSSQEVEVFTENGIENENMERLELVFDAQGGKLLDYTDKRKDRRSVPPIMTWEKIH